MKKIIYIFLFLFFLSLNVYCGLKGTTTPYPNIPYAYLFSADDDGPISVAVSAPGGKIDEGGSSLVVNLSEGQNSFSFSVVWSDSKAKRTMIANYGFRNKYYLTITPRSVKDVQTNISLSASDLSFNSSGEINITYGRSGTFMLHATAIDANFAIKNWNWYVNNQKISNTSSYYTYTYASDDSNGTTISVAATSDGCPTCSESARLTVKIVRWRPAVCQLEPQTWNSSGTFEASREVYFGGGDYYFGGNSAYNFVSGDHIIIDPNFTSNPGANLTFSVHPEYRSATIVDTTNLDSTYTFDSVFVDSTSYYTTDTTNLLRSVKVISNDAVFNNNFENSSILASRLDQNIPNPVDDEGVIWYYIPKESSKSSILVCDVTGRVIKRYSSLQKGKGKITIARNELLKGVYTYSLIVDNMLISTKKMIVN